MYPPPSLHPFLKSEDSGSESPSVIARGGAVCTTATELLPGAWSVGTAFGKVSQLSQSNLVLQEDSCWLPPLQFNAI